MDYRTDTLDEFLDDIASETVAPAGGTAAAVVGAISASLCEMVCIHTVQSGVDAGATEEITAVGDNLHRQREHLLNLAGADATVVDELFATEDKEVDQSKVKRSIGIPLTVAVACRTVLELAVEVTATGVKTALLDAGTGATLARSALQSAVLTAQTNVHWVTDQSFADEIAERTAELERRADNAHEQVLRHIESRS